MHSTQRFGWWHVMTEHRDDDARSQMQLTSESSFDRATAARSILGVKQLPFWSRCMAGTWSVAWLAAIDGAPAQMLRSNSAASQG